MSTFRTGSLFHYTDWKGLKSILQTGLIPNYCKEEHPQWDGETEITGIPMVSFCDIPLTSSDAFTSRYNRHHAIALSKKIAGEKHINPLLYMVDEKLAWTLASNRMNEERLKEEYEKQTVDLKGATDVQDAIFEKVYAGLKSTWAKLAVQHLYGYTKRYIVKHRGEDVVTYEENEWRYVVGESDKVKWYWGEEEYNKWRGDGERKPEPSPELKELKIKFEPKDVNHIIVERDEQVPRMIDFIGSLRQFGGIEGDIDDNDKKMLMSKVISFQSIKSDF